MKKISIWFCIFSILFGMGLGLSASANRRDARQAGRIREGVRSGQITRGEAHNLRRQQRHIHNMERRAGKDGVVTEAEQARIGRAQNRASQNIYKQKHDDQKRPETAPATPPAGGEED